MCIIASFSMSVNMHLNMFVNMLVNMHVRMLVNRGVNLHVSFACFKKKSKLLAKTGWLHHQIEGQKEEE